MKELFMKLLWFFNDNMVIESVSMRDCNKYADMDIVYRGKRFNVTIRDDGEDEEDA